MTPPKPGHKHISHLLTDRCKGTEEQRREEPRDGWGHNGQGSGWVGSWGGQPSLTSGALCYSI